MFKYNKLRYWLGLPCIVYTRGMYNVSKRELLFNRVYLDESDEFWWLDSQGEYTGTYSTHEKAYGRYIKMIEDRFWDKDRPV